MPFNASGEFSRVHNWVNDRNAAIPIQAPRMDAEFENFRAGLSSLITKNGVTTTTAVIPFAQGINISAAAPASPNNGDMWMTNQGLFLRMNGVSINIMPIGMEIDWPSATPPTGWLLEAGQQISRTTYSLLFSVIGTTYGAGNGSTTFTLPDKRGRVVVGKDDMNGSAASRVTSSSGVAATSLGAAGGNQMTQTHSHTISDSGHAHAVSDPGHAHGVTDFGHSHSVNDFGHFHSYDRYTSVAPATQTVTTANQSRNNESFNTSTSFANISIAAALANVFVQGAGTGISIGAATTSTVAQNFGSGSSQNMPPFLVQNKIIFAGV